MMFNLSIPLGGSVSGGRISGSRYLQDAKGLGARRVHWRRGKYMAVSYRQPPVHSSLLKGSMLLAGGSVSVLQAPVGPVY